MRGYYWVQDSPVSVCQHMYTACAISTGQGVHYMANLMIVSVSWALQLGPKKDRNAKKDVPQKLWILFWRACLRFSKNHRRHFWNFASVQLCTWLSKSDIFSQKLSGFVSGGQSWNSFSWNSPCVFDFGHFHVFKKLTNMISSWRFWKTWSVKCQQKRSYDRLKSASFWWWKKSTCFWTKLFFGL